MYHVLFSFQWLCHGLLSQLQILDDLFCCLYSSTPCLPPALIAYKKKSGFNPKPFSLPMWTTMLQYCFFRSMWGEITLRMFHVFYKKFFCRKPLSPLLLPHFQWRDHKKNSIPPPPSPSTIKKIKIKVHIFKFPPCIMKPSNSPGPVKNNLS